MLEMICAIPENVGWVIVGATGAVAVMMAVEVGKTIYRAIKRQGEED